VFSTLEVVVVEEFDSELARRKRAVELVDGGLSKAKTARRLGRSRRWVVKWIGRWHREGDDGLLERSRAPHSQPTKTPPRVIDKVLDTRAGLEKIPEVNIGALSVLAAMERDGFVPLPSIATIERILSRNGVTRPVGTTGRSGVKLPLPQVSTPGVWQQTDWVQDRYLEGGIRFNSLQVADVGSHGIVSGQFLDRTLVTAVTFLIEQAWPVLSIPQAMGTDNAFTHTTHRHNPFTSWTRACLWFGTEVIIGPPGSHGWNNHIEAVNSLWQRRTIRAQRFASLKELRAGSERACWWFNHRRPILDPGTCGTRYPAEYITAHTDQLRWPPDITVADHLDADGSLTIPLTAGRVTFIRHVTEQHTINVAGAAWDVPAVVPAGGLVVATIETHEHTLTIGHRGEPVATYPYPIKHPVADPCYPPAEHSLLHHV
jgi:putative transposase